VHTKLHSGCTLTAARGPCGNIHEFPETPTTEKTLLMRRRGRGGILTAYLEKSKILDPAKITTIRPDMANFSYKIGVEHFSYSIEVPP